MRRIAHLSDLHFGTVTDGIIDRLLSSMRNVEPDVVVITGDLTQRARKSQFLAAKAFLAALPCPYVVVPGNHDLAPLYRPFTRALNPFGRYRRYIHPETHMLYVDDELLVIGLNTADPFRWKEGGAAAHQLRWLKSALELHPGRTPVICSHHPIAGFENGRERARFTKLIQAIVRSDAHLCLSGHLHQSYSGVNTDSFAHGSVLVVHASTASSHRLRGHANAYNEVELEADRLRVRVHALGDDCFLPAQALDFSRISGAWRVT